MKRTWSQQANFIEGDLAATFRRLAIYGSIEELEAFVSRRQQRAKLTVAVTTLASEAAPPTATGTKSELCPE